MTRASVGCARPRLSCPKARAGSRRRRKRGRPTPACPSPVRPSSDGSACLMSPLGDKHDPAPDLAYYEAVPYLLVMESIERQGEWLRRAEYPELPGCVAEAPSAGEGFETTEEER